MQNNEEIKHGYNTYKYRLFCCSICGYGISDIYEEGDVLLYELSKEWNFCPNCGAKIDTD